MKIETQKDYDDFISYLISNKPKIREEDKRRHINIIATNYPCLHYKMDKVRSLAKEIYSNGYHWLIKYGKNLYYEEVLIKGLVIAANKDKVKLYEELEGFIPLIDSWSICDSVITSFNVFKKGADKQDYNKFKCWALSTEEFTSRFGLMMIFRYFIKPELIGDIFNVIYNLKSSAYYTKMGAAWLIAEMMVKFPNETEPYLKEKKLDKFIQNKSISKCRDSYRVDKITKERLKSYKVK